MVMRGNSAWSKNNKREIKHTWERYIAIVAIIILGVGFFSGLKVTKTAMVKNLDSYVNEYNMYDYRLLFTLGLTKADVEYFNHQEDIKAEGAITLDIIVDLDKEGEEKGIVLKAHSITDSINKLNILHGRMAEGDNEIVLDSKVFTEDIIGSDILITTDNDEDTIDAFKYDKYTVVGIADAPSYINFDRGTTSIGNGSVYGFAYITEDGFDLDYYTEIMLLMDTKGEVYSDEYEDHIAYKEEPLKEALEVRANLRYEDILVEVNETLAEAEKEYDEGYREYLSEKADAEAELRDAWAKLEDAKEEIEENEEKLKDGDIKLADAEAEYQKGLRDYQEGLTEFENQKADAMATLEASQNELNNKRETVLFAMAQIEESGVLTQYSQLKETISQLEYGLSQMSDEDSVEYLTMYEQLNAAKAAVKQIEDRGVIKEYGMLESSLEQLDAGQIELNKGKEEAALKLAEAEKALADGKAKLDFAFKEIEKNKEEIKSGWEALNEGKAEYEKGLIEYQDGKKEAEEAFAEAEEELAKARMELDDARKEVDDIAEPEVFILNRNHNSGYINFDNDSSIVDGIAEVLPIFFFLVAALVCSTTMTRMVDEQRTQIGTLKALGYGNGAITRKYIFYSGSAALIGCVGGFLLGTKFFPIAIWEAYGMLYDFSPIEYVFDIKLAIISLIVSLLCSAGVTYVSCKSELLQMPAALIRPKAPKAGKRVLLERLPFIWKRVSFLHKVSIRNILRYKRRFFMTITGIAGCTALIVAALGIRDSIKNVGNDQFESIMKYDYDILFTEELDSEERESFINTYNEELSEWVFVATDEVEIMDGDILKKTSVIATDDPNITKVIGLHWNGETVSYPTDGKVAISNNLADELDLYKGDRVTISVNPSETVDVEVGGVFENYMGNYLFMTGKTYSDILGKAPAYKNLYAKTDSEDIYSISAAMLKGDKITNVSVTKDVRAMVDNMMSSLDTVIWLVIACAGALGFVVIYNLNNINITERSREIATLKVIGFYQNETGSYIFRETITLTFIGALLGLGLGKLLHMFIMNEIKVEMVSFKEQIFGLSYLIAFLATFLVTFIVNWMLRKKIDRVNMAESLKSVE